MSSMIVNENTNPSINNGLIVNYIQKLVNKIFKILPMIENEELSVESYIESLEAELIGVQNFVVPLGSDSLYISMLGVIEWLRLNALNEECSFKRKRREIFNAISMCKKLELKFEEVR